MFLATDPGDREIQQVAHSLMRVHGVPTMFGRGAFSRKSKVRVGSRIEAGPEIAAIAKVFDEVVAMNLVDAVGAAAPGTALMLFDVTARRFHEPFTGGALDGDHGETLHGGQGRFRFSSLAHRCRPGVPSASKKNKLLLPSDFSCRTSPVVVS
jgi:hypothetical protein